MPQKANPVQAETIQVLNSIAISAQAGLAAAASPLEERDGTAWPLEWHFLPQMLLAAGAALVHADELATSLQAHEANLAATLASNPEIMAEAASFVLARNGISRAEAKDLVAAAAKDPAPFAEALARISPVSLDWQKELDPQQVVAPARDMSARIFQTRRRS